MRPPAMLSVFILEACQGLPRKTGFLFEKATLQTDREGEEPADDSAGSGPAAEPGCLVTRRLRGGFIGSRGQRGGEIKLTTVHGEGGPGCCDECVCGKQAASGHRVGTGEAGAAGMTSCGKARPPSPEAGASGCQAEGTPGSLAPLRHPDGSLGKLEKERSIPQFSLIF